MRQVFFGAAIFDGITLHEAARLVVENGKVVGIEEGRTGDVNLGGGILTPGFIDLQVNGGGGIMLDGAIDAGGIAAICATHILLGCAGVLPTLITDTPEATARVIAAGIVAAQANVPGFLGLHLEGPHLDPARAGAHDPALIRPMSDADLAQLLAAAEALPILMVTVSPSAVRADQIAALARAGVIVSLGHSACTLDEARAAFDNGASSVTHLFNAMSQLGSREPGLVGATLASDVAAGLIADGIHVNPASLRVALAARPRGMFLVSDCMAFAGTDMTEMLLGGRKVTRKGGSLSLADGTLAGADLRLDQALGVLVRQAGIAPAQALAMATSTPAALIGMGSTLGHLKPGRRADMVHLDPDLRIARIWWGGVPL